VCTLTLSRTPRFFGKEVYVIEEEEEEEKEARKLRFLTNGASKQRQRKFFPLVLSLLFFYFCAVSNVCVHVKVRVRNGLREKKCVCVRFLESARKRERESVCLYKRECVAFVIGCLSLLRTCSSIVEQCERKETTPSAKAVRSSFSAPTRATTTPM